MGDARDTGLLDSARSSLFVDIRSEVGSGAELAAVAMKHGDKQYLDKLETHLLR